MTSRIGAGRLTVGAGQPGRSTSAHFALAMTIKRSADQIRALVNASDRPIFSSFASPSNHAPNAEVRKKSHVRLIVAQPRLFNQGNRVKRFVTNC
jgi:hypothetical protein